MAKSLRSKWRRKCKAVKRERYGAKELARLKKTLGIDENAPQDVEMPEISEIATVVDAKKIRDDAKAKTATLEDGTEKMDVQTTRKAYNRKTLLDENGHYPIWMNRRKIIKHKKGRARAEKASAKSQKRLTRKQRKAGKQK